MTLMSWRKRASKNIEHFMERGPAISTGYGAYIVARDDINGWTYLGGLGGMGVGTMWSKTAESHRQYPGWDDAPTVETVACDGLAGYRSITRVITGAQDEINARSGVFYGTVAGFRKQDFPGRYVPTATHDAYGNPHE